MELIFTDSYKMIPMKLSEFGKAFDLPQKKEVMPYDLYTEEFVDTYDQSATRDQIEATPNFDDFEQLWMNVREWGCEMSDGRFDMKRYRTQYCDADVSVLKAG